MKLKDFYLEEYDNLNIEHKTIIIKLENDDLSRIYLGNLFQTVSSVQKRKNKYNQTYIVYYENIPVGIIIYTDRNKINELIYGIIEEYRNRHLTSLLLREFSDYLLLDKEVDELSLLIATTNIRSKKVAMNSGFIKEKSYKYVKKI